MQKLISNELVALRSNLAEHLERTYKGFDFAGRGCTQGQGLVEGIKEQLNDTIYFTVLDDIAMGREAYNVLDHIRETIHECLDDVGAMVCDFLGEEDPSDMVIELAEEFIGVVEQSVVGLRDSHWMTLVEEAQESIRVAAEAHGALGWLSSLCIDAEERTIFLITRDDLERVGTYVMDGETVLRDFVSGLENDDVLEYTFGSDRFVFIVNNNFTPDDTAYLSDEDVLIIYKLKRG